jgi:hypothetical protein
MKKILSIFTLLFIALAVSYGGMRSEDWLWRYSYVDDIRTLSKTAPSFSPKDEYFLVILVDARHADYTSSTGYLTSLAGSFVSQHYLDPGHAWIVLAGTKNGKPWVFEGGHTVNCPDLTKYYLKTVLGFSDEEPDPNPVRHLFSPTDIGSLEYGPGDSCPTFAAAIPLTEEGFDRVLKLFNEDGYDFSNWGIRGPNCVQFALSCLATVGVEFDCNESLPVPPSFSVFGHEILLWSDPEYSQLDIKTPDLLEKRLLDLVRQGTAQFALPWYKAFRQTCDEGYISLDEP